jgi:transposase
MTQEKQAEKKATAKATQATRRKKTKVESGAPFDEPKEALIGRPTKLTPEVSDTIVRYVRAGNYLETAAAAAGISRDTLHTWLRKGRTAKSGMYSEFADIVEKALGEGEIRDVLVIGEAARTHWQAAAWRLERKFPDRWGRRLAADVTLEATVDVGHAAGSAKHKLGGMLDRLLTADPVEAAKLVGSGGNGTPAKSRTPGNGASSSTIIDT